MVLLTTTEYVATAARFDLFIDKDFDNQEIQYFESNEAFEGDEVNLFRYVRLYYDIAKWFVLYIAFMFFLVFLSNIGLIPDMFGVDE